MSESTAPPPVDGRAGRVPDVQGDGVENRPVPRVAGARERPSTRRRPSNACGPWIIGIRIPTGSRHGAEL
ncbi:hypothetical protein [[Pseudopropionibacterium] massiliense]|uniref:hypothetical protein n=1 Tax=[Pseudopropionibacterium] massiliense TaxID=2220000 RepID=UPI0010309501|nr:hypothetical protein [[Pseudopropionibacterium] massiliense]